MIQIWALRSRLEKQPTDLRRNSRDLGDGTLVGGPLRLEISDQSLLGLSNASKPGGAASYPHRAYQQEDVNLINSQPIISTSVIKNELLSSSRFEMLADVTEASRLAS